MKKLIVISLMFCLSVSAWVGWNWSGWEYNGSNGINTTVVTNGVNVVYTPAFASPIGQTGYDGTYLLTIATTYSSLYTIEPELWDDISPKLKVNFQQMFHVTNGLITIGKKTYNNSVVGTSWWGSNLSTNVGVSIMTFTNGTWMEIAACFMSDGTRQLEDGGEIYLHQWTNYPTMPQQ